MADEPSLENVSAELDKLRSDFTQVRADMVNERVSRAEHSLAFMRTFMMVYTPLVTIAFFLFAFFGYKNYTDIEKSAQDSDRIVSQERDTFGALQAEMKQNSAQTAQLTDAVRTVSLGEPTLLLKPLTFSMMADNISVTIDGVNLGNTKGRLYVRAQNSFLNGSDAGNSIEIAQQSITEWKDIGVTFILSPTVHSALDAAKTKLMSLAANGTFVAPVVGIQAETASGANSSWVTTVVWPVSLPVNR